MMNNDDLVRKTEAVKNDLIQLHNDAGNPGEPLDFSKYEPAIKLNSELLQNIPELKDFDRVVADETPDPYMNFGIFGRYLVQQIQTQRDSEVVKRSLEFLARAFNDTDDENIRIMLSTEVIENLTVSEEVINFAKRHLTGPVAIQLNAAIGE